MSLQNEFDAEKTSMANGKAGIFRRVWDRLMAMDYSSFDYSMDRIGGLEREVARLKDELKQARASATSTAAIAHRPRPFERRTSTSWNSMSRVMRR